MGLRGIIDWVWPRTADGPTPALRMAAQYPHILPANATPEAYAAWLVLIGEDPGNPDLIEHYADVCEIAGWMIQAPLERHDPPPPSPVPPPERAPVPKRERAPSRSDTSPIRVANPVAVRESLRPHTAAVKFMDWVRDHEMWGEYTVADLDALYRRHCTEIGHAPQRFHLVKSELGALSGVRRGFSTVGKTEPTSSGEDRKRTRCWILFPTVAKAEGTQQPRRIAA